MLMLASGDRLEKNLCLFDSDLHPEAFVGLIIQLCRFLEVDDRLVRSYIVVSILKFSHAGGGTLCARTNTGEFEKSMPARHREKSVDKTLFFLFVFLYQDRLQNENVKTYFIK